MSSTWHTRNIYIYKNRLCIDWKLQNPLKHTRDELVARIMNSAALIKQERQDYLKRATRTVANRVEKWIELDGGIFEHFLWTVAIYWDNLHNQ